MRRPERVICAVSGANFVRAAWRRAVNLGNNRDRIAPIIM